MVDVLIDTCLQNFTTIYLQLTSQHMLSSSGFCGKAMQWHSLALDISSSKPSLVFAMDYLRASTRDRSSNLWLRWSASDVHPGGCVRATCSKCCKLSTINVPSFLSFLPQRQDRTTMDSHRSRND